ncbi:MAG TPA: hypothetical protein VFN10_21105 [Thermoanaerobaculia bacterium]|nr:hypothetical protein [Thermoanaerobaculia bacterium]
MRSTFTINLTTPLSEAELDALDERLRVEMLKVQRTDAATWTFATSLHNCQAALSADAHSLLFETHCVDGAERDADLAAFAAAIAAERGSEVVERTE